MRLNQMLECWCIIFSVRKHLPKLSAFYGNLKHYAIYRTVKYLGFQLDSNLSGESMEMKVLKKSIVKLKYFYLQNKYLVLRLKRLICNALTQLQLDYGGVSWFTPTKKNRKNRQMHTSLFEFTCPLSRRCNLS